MEIKTCEQYVISELFDAKNEVDRLQQALAEQKEAHQETLNKLSDVMFSFQQLKDLIFRIASVGEYSGNQYVGFNSLYENWDRDDFELLIKLIPTILLPKE